jgi:hypothetical protein
MQTFRRLNDGTRYYGLTWRGWLTTGIAGGLLYLAVRWSPLSYKPTISITLLVMTAAAMALYAVSGQALGPGRYVLAVIRWRLGPAQFRAPDEHDQPVSGGVLVDAVPLELADASPDQPWWQSNKAHLAVNGNGRIASETESENAP